MTRQWVLVGAAALLGAAGALTVSAQPAWSRFQVRSVSPVFLQGQPVGAFQAVYVGDLVNPELCVLVLRDGVTQQFAMVTVPRLSCDVHGSAQGALQP